MGQGPPLFPTPAPRPATDPHRPVSTWLDPTLMGCVDLAFPGLAFPSVHWAV